MRIDLPQELALDISGCGFFPDVVSNTLGSAIGDETPVAHFVHQEATFDLDVVGRHLTVLVLTETRLIVGHTDETDLGEGLRAVSSTEAIGLDRITAVALNQAVANPDRFRRSSQVTEAWLTIGWGIATRVDILPATCADRECDADHGYTGTLVADDINVRTSTAGDGEAHVSKLVDFATKLQQVVGRR